MKTFRLTLIIAAVLASQQVLAQVRLPLPDKESQILNSIVEHLDKQSAQQLTVASNRINTMKQQLGQLRKEGADRTKLNDLQKQLQGSKKQFGKQIKTLLKANPRLQSIVRERLVSTRLENDIAHTIYHDKKVLSHVRNNINEQQAKALDQNIAALQQLQTRVSQSNNSQVSPNNFGEMHKQLSLLQGQQKTIVKNILKTQPNLRSYVAARIDRHNKVHHPHRRKHHEMKRRNRSKTFRNKSDKQRGRH